jgi:hypothetical protein
MNARVFTSDPRSVACGAGSGMPSFSGRDRDFLSAELFGRHVGGGAGADVLDLADGGETEVHDAHLAGAVEHDVRRLQIPVQDAALVRRGEPRADLARDLEPLVFGKPADAAEQDGQILAVDVLHRDEELPVELADVVHAAHVRVRHGPRGPDLIVELREPHRVLREIHRQELERDLLSEAQVVGPVHLAHAAPPEQAEDAVAVVEDHPGSEAAVVDRAGRVQPARLRRRGRGWSRCMPGDGGTRDVVGQHRDVRRRRGTSAAGAEAASRRQRRLAVGTAHYLSPVTTYSVLSIRV